jgi:hypothetical protein
VSYFRDTPAVGFERKNNFPVERWKLRQGMVQPAMIFLFLFEAIIRQELLFLFPFYCDFRPAPPDRIKSASNSNGSKPSSEALLLSVCGQRPESFQESFLRGIFGEPPVSGDSKGRADRHCCMTANESLKSRNLARTSAAREIIVAWFGFRHFSGCQSGHFKKS